MTDVIRLLLVRGREASASPRPRQVADAFQAALERRGIAVAALAPEDDSAAAGTVFRRSDPLAALGEVAARFRPTVLLAAEGERFAIARAARAAGLKAILYHQDVALHRLGPPPDLADPGLLQLADSAFAAGRYERVFGQPVERLPPLFRPRRAAGAGPRRKLLLVDPVAENGLEVVLGMAAAAPHRVFELLAAQPLAPADRYRLEAELRRLPNLLLRSLPAGGLAEVLSETRLLLAPFREEESWCGAVLEAQAQGIPTLGSMIGGLPEMVGRGGVLLDPLAPVAAWSAALARLLEEEKRYAACAAAAEAQAARAEIAPEAVLERLLALLQRHGAAGPRAPAAPRGKPGVSVVIPTHGRPGNLARLLESLRPQLAPDGGRQCIIVNDGSHDARYAALVERHRDHIDYVALAENAGPAAARNAGAARARHATLAFIDDDCVAPPYWLDWLEGALAENPDLEMIGGTTRPLTTELPGLLEPLLVDCGYYPMPILYGDEAMILVSACLAVGRARFALVGGFDPAFRIGEDRNLTFRLKEGRAVTAVDPGWYVYHDMTATLGQHLRRYFAYGYWLARELELEGRSPDRQLWPIDDRSLASALKRMRESLAYIRTRPGYAARPPAGRAAMQLLALLTRLTMDWGVVRGKAAAARRPPAA